MLPLPSEPYVTVPGLARASATNSGTLLAATAGCTTNTSGGNVVIDTGANPFSASDGSLLDMYEGIYQVNIEPRIMDSGRAALHAAQTWLTTTDSRGTTHFLLGLRKPRAGTVLTVENVNRVADAVVHMAGLPLDVNIQFMTIMASKMPFVGRG